MTFLSGDFSLSCGATANLPPWSAVVKVNLDFFYTIRVEASDLLNILTGQSPGRICLSIVAALPTPPFAAQVYIKTN